MSTVIVAVLLFLASAILYVKRKFSYWSRRNVPNPEPRLPYGNFKDLWRTSAATFSSKIYAEMKDSSGGFFGLYFFLEPILVVTDLDLIKAIMIKDFAHFPDRGQYYNARDDPVSAHLFNIEGNAWRSLRARLTPTFTSGKMKMMFPTLRAVGDNLGRFLSEAVGEGCDLELKDCMARFTTDVIGSCAFGIECNSLEDPDSRFRTCGQMIFDRPRHSTAFRLLLKTFPEVGRFLRVKLLRSEPTEFFYRTVQDIVEFRKGSGVERNDFLNLLLELERKGVDLSMDEIAAQSFVFFTAGFETSSSTQTFCLYELALRPDCQEKARKCVLDAIRKHGGLTYEAVCDMGYLDQCINETLRKYPTLPILERRTFKDYQIPGSDVVIQKGVRIQIPVFAIQHDERYYPDPEHFDPGRFSPEADRHISTFLPFGEGPRVCIGQRFGMLQSRVGIATVLARFKVGSCAKSQIPLQISSKSAVLQPQQGVWLRVEPL